VVPRVRLHRIYPDGHPIFVASDGATAILSGVYVHNRWQMEWLWAQFQVGLRFGTSKNCMVQLLSASSLSPPNYVISILSKIYMQLCVGVGLEFLLD
jgi:hypothetical protein